MYIENTIPKIPAPHASAEPVVTTAPVVNDGGGPGQDVNIITCSTSATAAPVVSTTVTAPVVSDDSGPSQDFTTPVVSTSHRSSGQR